MRFTVLSLVDAEVLMLSYRRMPLYEYTCLKCKHEFETLVRTGDTPSCPECGSTELEKLLSDVAVSSENIRERNLGEARKRAKVVSRDKAIAQFEYEEKHRHHH
jgi:putative FmdB family regulatory protein